jgi:hypothetical protein
MALRVRVTALNNVDFPTFGSPTIPAFSIIKAAKVVRDALPDKGEFSAEPEQQRRYSTQKHGYPSLVSQLSRASRPNCATLSQSLPNQSAIGAALTLPKPIFNTISGQLRLALLELCL